MNKNFRDTDHHNVDNFFCMGQINFIMQKKDFLIKLAKVFKKKSISENDRVEDLDSLNFLDFLEFSDSNFKNFDFPVNKFRKCKTVDDLIKLYGNKIN